MADFDPDAYLAAKQQAAPFDPDAYLASKGAAPSESTPVMDLMRATSRGVGSILAGLLPPTSSPLGFGANLATGGIYGAAAPEHGGLYQAKPEPTPRAPGESDRDYSIRSAHAEMKEAGSDAGFGRNFAAVAGTIGGMKGDAAPGPPVPPGLPVPKGGAGLAAPAAPPGGGAPPPNILRRAVEAVGPAPIPEAVYLRERGVPLTAGQMNPRSPVGQIEEASTSLRHTGPSISAQRELGRTGWQGVVLKQALPPGMDAVPTSGTLGEKLDAVYQGFRPAYAEVKGVPVEPSIAGGSAGPVPLQSSGNTVGAFDRAVTDPGILADDVTRSTVKKYLDNQLTVALDKQTPAAPVPVENLIKMRSNIRDAAGLAERGPNPEMGRILRSAEHAVTSAVETQLPPELSAKLRQVDAQYRAYKILEKTIGAAKDSPAGFTPGQLTDAVRASMNQGKFARGGGGDLRQLARAGRAVFESVSPPTGARLLTVGPLGEWGTGPLSFLLNRPGGGGTGGGMPPLGGAGPAIPPLSGGLPSWSWEPASAATPGEGVSRTGARSPAGSTSSSQDTTGGTPGRPSITGGDRDGAEHFQRWMRDPAYQDAMRGGR